jgi:hypothetical protein
LIEINIYEQKFLDILKGESSVEVFENWLYRNEEMLTTQLPIDVYNELIFLNYKTKESKHDLAKVLDIDFEKLELYEIQCLIRNELGKESILNNVNSHLSKIN